MNIENLRTLTATVVRGKKWLVLADSDSAANHFAQELLDLGALDVMVLAATRDSPLKAIEPAYSRIDLGTDGSPGSLGHIRSCLHAFKHLPDHVRDAIDDWDPTKEAVVITPFWAEDLPVHGRPVFGARWPKWQQLENKMTCDAIWDALEIPRAQARVLPMYEAALQAAHRDLDAGMGTVWAGDNKEGWHGGAEYVRWIRSDRDLRGIIPFFRSHCDQVRIQPFLNGIPCSIHGIVYPDEVVSFRPCEMLVFRQSNSTRFRYAGAATTWDPPRGDREYLRNVASRVGVHLRALYGYRGAFTIDGVMTQSGFLPTELNPRYGAAIPRLTSSIRNLPLYLLNKIVCEGISLPYNPKDLEQVVLEAADTNRVVWAGFSLPNIQTPESMITHFSREKSGWIRTPRKADASVELHSSGTGSHLRVILHPHACRVGDSEANAVASLVTMTSEEMGHGLDDIEPAPNIRS